MTAPGGKSWIQTIYWPFLYTSRYGRGTARAVEIDCPTYDCALRSQVKVLSCATVEDRDTVTLFAVNRDLENPLTLELADFPGKLIQHVTLTAPSIGSVNTQDSQPVPPPGAHPLLRACPSPRLLEYAPLPGVIQKPTPPRIGALRYRFAPVFFTNGRHFTLQYVESANSEFEMVQIVRLHESGFSVLVDTTIFV